MIRPAKSAELIGLNWQLVSDAAGCGDAVILLPADVPIPSVDEPGIRPDWILLGVLIVFGLFDAWLAWRGKGTVSQRFKRAYRRHGIIVPIVTAAVMVVLFGHFFFGWLWN